MRPRKSNLLSAAPSGDAEIPGATGEASSQQLAVADGTFSEDDRLRGEQLTAAFHDANDGLKRVLVFGAMMMEQKRVINSTRGVVRTGGAGAKGTGFKAWLAECAPEVAKSEGTAYRYMALAEGVHEALKLGRKVDLSQLLAAGDEELSPTLKKKQSELLDLISGKSARQLLLELGGGEKKAKGGKREKSGEGDGTLPEEAPAGWAQPLWDRYRALADDDERAAFDALYLPVLHLRADWDKHFAHLPDAERSDIAGHLLDIRNLIKGGSK